MVKTADDTRALIALCLPSMTATTPVILRQVDHALHLAGLDGARDDVQIVLAEALNNVAEHACRTVAFGSVALRLDHCGDTLGILLTDWGQELPGGTIPDGRLPTPDEHAEGGYGWALIRALASDIRYDRTAGMNRLRLSIRL